MSGEPSLFDGKQCPICQEPIDEKAPQCPSGIRLCPVCFDEYEWWVERMKVRQ